MREWSEKSIQGLITKLTGAGILVRTAEQREEGIEVGAYLERKTHTGADQEKR